MWRSLRGTKIANCQSVFVAYFISWSSEKPSLGKHCRGDPPYQINITYPLILPGRPPLTGVAFYFRVGTSI
jgi:hypothetical protein